MHKVSRICTFGSQPLTIARNALAVIVGASWAVCCENVQQANFPPRLERNNSNGISQMSNTFYDIRNLSRLFSCSSYFKVDKFTTFPFKSKRGEILRNEDTHNREEDVKFQIMVFDYVTI